MKQVIDITAKAETNNKRGAELMEERYKELWLRYLSKNKVLRRMEEEPFDVPTYMLTKQEALLDAMDVVSPGGRTARPRRRGKAAESPFGELATREKQAEAPKKPKRERGETYAKTYEMFLSGMRPEAIAKERGLATATVYGHLARFVKTGVLPADRVIDASKVKAIRHAIARLPEGATMSDIKAACRDDITWDDIRFILNGR